MVDKKVVVIAIVLLLVIAAGLGAFIYREKISNMMKGSTPADASTAAPGNFLSYN